MIAERTRYLILTGSVLPFFFSLFCPCYFVESGNGTDGYLAFLTGWSGMGGGAATAAWMANPLLILAWTFNQKKGYASVWLSGVAFLFAIIFYFDRYIGAGGEGSMEPIIRKGSGYFLWLLSMAFYFVALFILIRWEGKQFFLSPHGLDGENNAIAP